MRTHHRPHLCSLDELDEVPELAHVLLPAPSRVFKDVLASLAYQGIFVVAVLDPEGFIGDVDVSDIKIPAAGEAEPGLLGGINDLLICHWVAGWVSGGGVRLGSTWLHGDH